MSDENQKKRNRKRIDSEDLENTQTPKRPRRLSDLDRDYYKKIQMKSRESEWFRKLCLDEQIKIIDKETEVERYYQQDIPLRYRILLSDMNMGTKSFIIQKIDQFENMNPYEGEYHKLDKWLKSVSCIPFGTYVEMPILKTDEDYKIHRFLYESYQKIDNTIYGQEEAKNKMIQIVAQWISNPLSRGQMIALEGPPGVGKTSFVKNGVSKVLNRPFSFYALGGASDACHLEGHSYTYEGANYGRIVQMLMESKVMNPIVFFDELDKISNTSRGQEITGILTHLTDTSQNNTFQDKYFAGIDLDISRILFFFSYNDIQLIHPILKDRLTIIKFEGYKTDEKIKIAMKHMIPQILMDIGFEIGDIIFTKEVLRHLIQTYCHDEKGVRNMKRCLEDVVMKINLLRLFQTSNRDEPIEEGEVVEPNKIFPYHIDNLTLPYEITNTVIDKLLRYSSISKREMNTMLSTIYV
jgi:ATP-dependent Lon protease